MIAAAAVATAALLLLLAAALWAVRGATRRAERYHDQASGPRLLIAFPPRDDPGPTPLGDTDNPGPLGPGAE